MCTSAPVLLCSGAEGGRILWMIHKILSERRPPPPGAGRGRVYRRPPSLAAAGGRNPLILRVLRARMRVHVLA